MKVIEALVPGRVIAIKGTVDKRDDSVRATAQKVKMLQPDADLPPRAKATGRTGRKREAT